jgi:putative SOS response-associated peptidase YedK
MAQQSCSPNPASKMTVNTKPVFRDAFAKRRCIIPVGGIYEWKEPKGAKQPFAIAHKDGGLLPLAGLWDRWKDPASGEIVRSCTIVTCAADELVSELHNRMPVVLDPAAWAMWLGEAESGPDEFKAMLRPCPSDRLTMWPVSKAVNNVRNEHAELLTPMNSA